MSDNPAQPFGTGDYDFLNAVINSMPGKLVIRDRTSRILFANEAFAGPYGRTAAGVTGMLNADLWMEKGRPRSQVDEWIAEDNEVLDTGIGREYIQEIVRKGGERAYHHNFKQAFRFEGQLCLMAQYTDITERRRLELKLFEFETRAAELAGIRKMVVTYAHQINNPLAGILANAQLMEEHPELDAECRELLTEIRTAGERIRDVVRHLSDEKEFKTTSYLDRHEMLDV